MTFSFQFNRTQMQLIGFFLHPNYSFLLLKNWLKPPFQCFFSLKFNSLIENKKENIYFRFHAKNNRKHSATAVKMYTISENKISFIKDIEITDEKTDTMYSALSNEIEKRGRVESLSRFGSDGAGVIIGHKVA